MQSTILRDFRKAVTPQFISEMARKVCFNKRSTAQISGIDFARMLIMQVGSGREITYSNLNATISKLNRKINVSNQALSEYFFKNSSVELLKSIYEKIFTFQKQALSEKCSKDIEQKLGIFNRILIQDSTMCVLHNALASSILITNIPRDLVAANIIGTIYRVRWKIELIFKTWKSELNLQKNLEVRKRPCVLCIIYATLIVCLLTTIIHGWLKRVVDSLGKEISLDKLSKWLVNRCGCFGLFVGAVEELEVEMQKDLRRVRMQKRKRKTVIERAMHSEAYGEKYAINI